MCPKILPAKNLRVELEAHVHPKPFVSIAMKMRNELEAQIQMGSLVGPWLLISFSHGDVLLSRTHVFSRNVREGVFDATVSTCCRKNHFDSTRRSPGCERVSIALTDNFRTLPDL